MTPFERIVEAIETAQDEETNWWDEFDSVKEAQRMLKNAKKSDITDWEAIQLAELLDIEIPTTPDEIEKSINDCFSMLKKSLKS